jgi:hypothetical protein
MVKPRLQDGCYTLNLNTKLVHSSNCHTLPWAHISHVCVRVDAERVRTFPLARPCKFCMTLFNIRVMHMEDRIGWDFARKLRIGETQSALRRRRL